MNGKWKTVKRPGYAGKHRDEKQKKYDKKYGKGNWRIVWELSNGIVLDKFGVYALYEDAYFAFLQKHLEIVTQLINEASNVYDDEPSNVESGFDYAKQETKRTHLQDISIRKCLIRLGLWFNGKQLIRIRDKEGNHPLSMTLSPGKVPFHKPGLITQPELTGWWNEKSIESFYQSTKVLQIRVKE